MEQRQKIGSSLIVLGGLGLAIMLTLMGCGESYSIGDNITVKDGFYRGCQGVLIAQTDQGYAAQVMCPVQGEMVGPLVIELNSERDSFSVRMN